MARLTQKEIRAHQMEALRVVQRYSAYAQGRMEAVTAMLDDLRWAMTSPDMPPKSWAVMRRSVDFWRWLREYRKHVESLSPRQRAKLRRLKSWR